MRKAILLGLWVACCTSRREETGHPQQAPVVESTRRDTAQRKDYALVRVADGVYVEQFDSTNTDQNPYIENRYTQNNQVYRAGHAFTYSYQYRDTLGQPYYSKSTKDGWAFVPADRADAQTLKQVIIRVEPGGMGADYNQTVVSYHYPPNLDHSASGVIENEKNIWMHPPRDGLFRVLELNPFPFIQAPYRVGNQWNWELSIGSHWGDTRWKEWQGTITNRYQYRISGHQQIETRLGTLPCWEVTSTAQSELGKTGLIAYFNPEHGFVRLNYTNIDGSRLVMELIEHQEK